MAAFVVFCVAALIFQASAQLITSPMLAKSFLQPIPSPVPQICPTTSNLPLLPINNCKLPQTPSILPDLPIIPFTSCVSVTNPPPVISTTVVDNSLANSLANTLQLLIVSELLEASLTPAPVSPYISNLVPLYEAIGTIGTVDIFTPIDVATVNYNPVVEVSTVVTDVIAPTIAPAVPLVDIKEVQAPIASYAPVVTEVAPLTTYSQNIYAPVTEIIAPAPITEVITPVTSTVTNIYGSIYEGQVPLVTEVTSSIPPIPTVDVFTSITDINSISVTPTPLINPYYGVTEYFQSPSCVTEVSQISTPISYLSDYYSGYADVITSVPTTVPFAAELILPQSIPAQIVCNFGYSPLNIPFVSMNVEPAPIGGYVF